MDLAVKLSAISKSFGEKRAVNSLDMEIRPGEVYGFLGPNGAGKTTSIRILMGILEQDSGIREVLGERDITRVRQRIGYLPEERGLYQNMTAPSLIAYFATLKGMDGPYAKKRAKVLLERFGLGEAMNKKIKSYSKGMAQKVQVLATIIHDPDLVVLDEPFSGLDPVNQSVLEDLIGELKRKGKTVIFSTHVMQHAERQCDRIHILANGETQFVGNLNQARKLLPTQLELLCETPPDELFLNAHGAELLERTDDGLRYGINLNGTKVNDILRSSIDAGLTIDDVTVHRPTLHEVFIHLVRQAEEVGK
ncbi:MAG: ATP-binding cassette domain-containing protein [Sphingomonadales bacterium]|jgi:ABC-2 type transport system ATP-binding protein